MNSNGTILAVRDLAVQFQTDEGIVQAVNGIRYEVGTGGSLGIVGESGSGKSVSSLAVLRLIQRPAGQITGGEVIFDGQDLLKISVDEMRRIRGGKIAMVFQDSYEFTQSRAHHWAPD